MVGSYNLQRILLEYSFDIVQLYNVMHIDMYDVFCVVQQTKINKSHIVLYLQTIDAER